MKWISAKRIYNGLKGLELNHCIIADAHYGILTLNEGETIKESLIRNKLALPGYKFGSKKRGRGLKPGHEYVYHMRTAALPDICVIDGNVVEKVICLDTGILLEFTFFEI